METSFCTQKHPAPLSAESKNHTHALTFNTLDLQNSFYFFRERERERETQGYYYI